MTVINRRQTTSIATASLLLSRFSGYYTIPVDIGTPSQTLNLTLDTGSPDFWVWSSLLPSDNITNHNYYNVSASTSALLSTGQTFSTPDTYGPVWQDTIYVGNFGVSGNPIETAESIDTVYGSLTDIDGVFGLALSSNDSEYPSAQQTWLDYMNATNQFALFAVSLSANSPSSIDFGYINASRYTGSLVYTPVTPLASNTALWGFTWDGFAIGSEAYNTTDKAVIAADTGLNYVTLPPSVAASYYSQVTGATVSSGDGNYVFPCNSTLPSFTFIVAASRFVVPGGQLTFGTLADNATCYGAIQSSGNEAEGFFGTPFLEGIYTVYDYGARRLGFAVATSPNY